MENILKRLGIHKKKVRFEPLQNEIFATGMQLRTDNSLIGSYGIVSAKLCKLFDIDTEVFFADLNWDMLMRESEKQSVHFAEISRFPSVSRDLALLIDKNITFAQIEQIALKTEKKLLKQVSLFDVYEGGNLPGGKKSYAVNFLLQDEEKTLNDNQIDAVIQKIRHNLERELGAQLR